MHLLKNKNKIYFYIFSFLFLTTISSLNFGGFFYKNFLINKIIVDTETPEIKKKILSKTIFLKKENIFKIDKKILKENIIDLKFLENVEIKKIYPSTISIKATKTNLIAITYIDQKKHYIGSNGNFISTKNISNQKKLPLIFGQFKISSYISLKNILKENKINDQKIIKYYFHKSNRWDLYFENNILLKLPTVNLTTAIQSFKQYTNNKKIRPNSILDLRIPNRLIITNE